MKSHRKQIARCIFWCWAIAAGSGAQAADLLLNRTIGGPALMEMYPTGVTVDPTTGNLIVADTGNDRLIEYAPDGTQLKTYGEHGPGVGQFSFPRAVRLDQDGNIYVTDAKNGRVVKLRRDYSWVKSWYGPGVGPTARTYALGMSVKNDRVYVAEGARGVHVWDLDLTNEFMFIKPNGACNFTGTMRDADADRAGNIYISDYKANGVFVVRPDGTCIQKLSGNGHGAYALRVAHDPVLREELLYEQGADSLRVYRLDGSYVGGVSPSTFLFEARLIDVAPDGDIWVADFHGNHIKRFDRTSSGWVETQVIPTDSPPDAVAPKPLADDAMFNTVQDIAFGSDGTGYAVDYMNNRIVRFTPDGRALNACLDRPSAGWPKGVAIDPETDDVWFPQPTYNLLGIIRPDCTPVATLRPGAVPGFKALNDPQAIAIRAADRIAFVADRGNGRILAYDVANRIPLAEFGSPGSGPNQFNSPRGIAIHPVTGTVLVADSGNDRIVELSFDRGAFRWIRTLGEALFTWGHPQGVAADRSGRIYAADTGRNQVLVMDATGTLLSTIPDLAEPTGIAVSPTDEVFIADTHNDRIRVYTYDLGNRLINPGFENDFQGWSGAARGQLTTSDVHGGGKAALFSSPTAFTNFFAQTVRSLPTGRYSASVWYKRVGSIKWAHLGVKVRNAGTGEVTYSATNPMRVSGAWSQARLDDIPVTSGEVVQFSVWMEMNAGGALYLDDALLQ